MYLVHFVFCTEIHTASRAKWAAFIFKCLSLSLYYAYRMFQPPIRHNNETVTYVDVGNWTV